ncbi:MAG: SpoIIE family protein phosphatase [Actinomycetales bacterium]|nr:SpoIIE family protein phosphatase [Actinomycetales bacterium]
MTIHGLPTARGTASRADCRGGDTGGNTVIDLTPAGFERALRAAEQAELRAREEAEASHRRLLLLARLSRLLISPLDVDVLLRHVADLVVEDFADWCLVDLQDRSGLCRELITHRDPEHAEIAAEADRLLRPRQTAERVLEAVRSLETLVSEELDAERLVTGVDDPRLRDVLARLDPRSVVVVPLVANGVGIGALTLLRCGSRRFTVEDAALATELGRRAGSATEKARLYTERDRVARVLQRSLQPPDVPDIPGLEIGTHYRPWTAGLDVGGDFYDAFRSGEHWWLVLGDVCGKGPAAAAVGTAVRHTLRALLLDDTDPEDALRRVNVVLDTGERDETFTTVVVARLTRVNGGVRLRVATGGHLPPLVRRRDGTVTPVPVRGTLLGLLPRIEVGQAEVWLDAGETLLLYTDGITEATVPRGRQLGIDAVHALFARAPAHGAQELVDTIAEGVLEQAQDIRDDLALLALHVPAEPAS